MTSPQVRVPKTPAPSAGEATTSPVIFSGYDDSLHLAWAEFLKTQPWQWFVTFTFKDEIHPEAADKLFRVWINNLNKRIYTNRWGKRPPYGCKWVRALEWQKRGVLHYHALIANVGYADRAIWAEEWRQLGETSKAGFIQIDQYDESLGGAESYLSKYVTKGGQIDISRNFELAPDLPDLDYKRRQTTHELDRA